MASYTRIRVKTALSRSGLPDLDYCLNPYVGCQHGCLYCYARDYTRHREVAENWGYLVYVKENLISVLETEVRKLRPGVVGVSTITDPYQRAELTENLTRRSLEILIKRGFRVSIQTKSPLVLRDLDILSQNRELVDVGFTIITLDPKTAKLLEPGAPLPKQRTEALIRVSEEGVRTWLFYGPVIPGFNDDATSFKEILEAVGNYVGLVLLDKLRVTPSIRRSLSTAIDNPEEIRSLSLGGKWWDGVTKVFTEICRRLGVKCVASLAEPPAESVWSLDSFRRR